MLRASTMARQALCATAITRNFFPLGYSSGPKNKQILSPPNNLDGRTTHHMKKLQGSTDKHPGLVHRDKLKLHCESCRFHWVQDTLVVRCPAHPAEHNQREIWLEPTWTWGKQQPYQYYKYMPVNINPRTRMHLAREDAKGMNNERRSQGLPTKTRLLETERRGISRAITQIGHYNQRWQTRFPFAT
ncbi:hypothetical protein ABB37_05939 [Leptomonas pyrrhocoris]|uniref:Uncharacterized protein n=1 Tax=Leptomonas pyrrhocoris TaxID=157538 RepID=A0A0M9FZ35_LEPPY|nr:hypothetical protein ABB37_05939 [Leptomonas pyrrhocoris]XP_015657308.1 hypothetical protein ABB37_05939 [Leptomonas pyrrhocoris]KPA78868.1 hypothetical protein ABB37_05939 [Leptomonas pyrrhocoris]KPA78869.1 hypothetical protein ABB37_05939 [Leptomonas pyrrhocoris]|eukprot:XP_015657307.1 hypothetical protein ABB37_05939 [Leptomonas pyrrhocoris]